MKHHSPSFRAVPLPAHIDTCVGPSKYADQLRDKGWEPAGTGSYAKVYAKGNRVIKIAIGDDAYDCFLSYVLANQNNPYLPKIYKVERFIANHGSTYTVVEMEKLSPIYQSRNRNQIREVTQMEEDFFYTHKYVWKKSKAYAFVAALMDYLREYVGHRPDLHTGNVMMRGNQLVITDPLF